ncbi:hypothetical protein JCM8202v2_004472 [Rhodotorula sphaerocarpa]
MARDLTAELHTVQQELEDARNVVAGAAEFARRIEQDGRVEPDADVPDLPAIRQVLAQAKDDVKHLEHRLAHLQQLCNGSAPDSPRSDSGVEAPYSVENWTNDSTENWQHGSGRSEDHGEEDSRQEPDPTPQMLLAAELDLLAQMPDPLQRIRSMDAVVERFETETALKYELQIERFLPSIMSCLEDGVLTEVRAGAYRLLRHLVVDAHDAAELNRYHLEYFLVKTLARDARCDLEKEQSLRLVRVLIEHTGPRLLEARDTMPMSVLRAVIAVADAPEEKLRLAALELLGELIVRNLPLLVVSGGLRSILEALSESLPDFGSHVARLFLVAVDHPETRQWLRPGIDLEVILAGFTEVYGSGALVLEKVKASAGIVVMLLKSWSGLFYLNISGRQAVTSLVDSLSNPSADIRGVLLDMLIDVFSVRAPSSGEGDPRGTASARPGGTGSRCNLLDQYLAILLLVFAEAGLPDALSALATDPQDPSTAAKVSQLIALVLDVAGRVLPPHHAMRIQALPKLVALALSFDTSEQRRFASTTLLSVDDSRRWQRNAREVPDYAAAKRAALPQRAKQSAAALREQIEQSRRAAASQIDDMAFRNLLLQSEVLSTRSDIPWRCDILLELVDGPLRDPKRLEETTRATKFMSRLLGFFHPFSLRYSDMPRSTSNAQWTRLGCALLETLLDSAEGRDYLAEDQLLRQIAESLFQIDSMNASSGVETIFSRDRVEHTLTRGYFEMIGLLSGSRQGLRLLDQARIFTAIHRLAELRSRDDLVILAIENLNYSLDGHARVFLGRVLTSSFRHIRLIATRHLGKLLTEGQSEAVKGAPDWLVRLLVQQLYDSAPDIVRLAIQTVEQICQDDDVLEQVLALQPALELVGDHSADLLKRFLATPTGVRYLDSLEYIQHELEIWFDERNLQYMVEAELALASAFSPTPQENKPAFDGVPLPHFYGELVQTNEGCRHLRESGHLDDFAAIVSLHEDSDLDEEYVVMLKTVLWALGHIGSSSPGLVMLDEYDILTQIVQIAAFSPVYSLRGTATFALCLLSSTEVGAEMLDELGWDSVFDLHGRAVGLCVPSYLADYIARDILNALADLSNHILAAKASRTLTKIKLRHPLEFRSSIMTRRALQMLSEHQFRLVSRRFVLELFDAPLTTRRAAELAGASFDLVRASQAAFDIGSPSPALSSAVEAPINGLRREKWQASGIAESLLGAVEGDEISGADEMSEVSATGSLEPRVLTPIITVRGFLLA